VEKWRETHAKKLAPKTIYGYNYMLDQRILSAMVFQLKFIDTKQLYIDCRIE